MTDAGNRRRHGFTLLEVMIVLVIAAAGYALVARVSGLGPGGAELRSAARALAAGLRDARGSAVIRQEPTALTVDVESRVFWVGDPGRLRVLPARLEIKLYTAASELVDAKTGSIRFYPDGTSTGGRLTVVAGERKVRVDVDWLTGRVSIRDGA